MIMTKPKTFEEALARVEKEEENMELRKSFQECFDKFYYHFTKCILSNYRVRDEFEYFVHTFFKSSFENVFNNFSELLAAHINKLFSSDFEFRPSKCFLKPKYGVISGLNLFVAEYIAKLFNLTPDYAYFISFMVDLDFSLLDDSVVEKLNKFVAETYGNV